MKLIPILLVPAAAALWLAVPASLAVGFFLWWRRVRHWSFAVLALSCSLSVIAQVSGFLARNIPRWGKSEEQVDAAVDILSLVYVSMTLHFIMGLFLLVGALGLISAAREAFILDDAHGGTPGKSDQPTVDPKHSPDRPL